MERYMSDNQRYTMKDYGNKPLVFNIDNAAKVNSNFRTALWTGKHMQMTLMSIPPGGEIGFEMHPDTDQFICIVSGYAYVMMGNSKENLDYQKRADANYSIIIPAGTWHNIKNIGRRPLKVYSIYAPPQHPFGTVHKTKQDAESQERH